MQWPELSEAHRWLVVGARGETLAYYGGSGAGGLGAGGLGVDGPSLPYGLEPTPATLGEASG